MIQLVTEARGRIFRRKGKKYLIYVPLKLAEDSMFPFKLKETRGEDKIPSVKVNISFKIYGNKLIIERLKEEPEK